MVHDKGRTNQVFGWLMALLGGVAAASMYPGILPSRSPSDGLRLLLANIKAFYSLATNLISLLTDAVSGQVTPGCYQDHQAGMLYYPNISLATLSRHRI